MQSQLIQHKSLGFFRGVQDMLPLSVAVILWGILAGSAAINAGLSVMQAVGMSALVFAGTAQLVSLSMLMTGASLLSILITVFFSNQSAPYLCTEFKRGGEAVVTQKKIEYRFFANR